MAEYINKDEILKRLCKLENSLIETEGHYNLFTKGFGECLSHIKNFPSTGVVSVGVLQQVMWERDTAIKQLEDYGVGLGEVADLVKVVRCKDCTRYLHRSGRCWRMCFPMSPDDYCSKGERRVDNA